MRKSKLRSSTFWITLWSVVMVTIGLPLHWEASVLLILAGAIAVYIGGEKAITHRFGDEDKPSGQ